MNFELPPISGDQVRTLLHTLGISSGLAMFGRLAWHTTQVRAKKRRFFGWELLFEVPMAVFCGAAALGMSSVLGLEGMKQVGFISIMSYLGPGAIEHLFWRLVERAGIGPVDRGDKPKRD